MNNQQKQQFGIAVKDIIHAEDETVMQTLTEMSTVERFGMWSKVGEQIGVTQRLAADYFHNTWSKQFYKRPKSYKNQIRELLNQYLPIEEEVRAVDIVVDTLNDQYPGLFHQVELRKYINRQIGKNPAFTGQELDSLLQVLGKKE